MKSRRADITAEADIAEHMAARFDNACDAGTCDACNGLGPLAVTEIGSVATDYEGPAAHRGGAASAGGGPGAEEAAEAAEEGVMATTYKAGDRVEVDVHASGIAHGSVGVWVPATVTYAMGPNERSTAHITLDYHPTGGVVAGYQAIREWLRPLSVTPIATRPTDPAPPADPLLCPRCSTPSHPVAMRTRGEVRSRVWQCGCPVRPTDLRGCVLVASMQRGAPVARGWCAEGHGVDVEHPTEAGAVAAWRVALEQRQREDDERAVQPAPAGETIGPQPWQRGALRSVLHAWAVRRSHAEVLGRFAPPSVPTGREVFGYAAADSAPDGTVTVNVGARPAGGDPAGKAVREIMLTRERRVALCDRTDYEVRHAARACTADTDVETLVAVANECARRWANPYGAATFTASDSGQVAMRRAGRKGWTWLAPAAVVVVIGEIVGDA